LENEETKLWRLGYHLLYDLLEEKVTTGNITYTEEQKMTRSKYLDSTISPQGFLNKPEGSICFLASCIELYKDEKGYSGAEAYNYLRKTGAIKYIIECWDGLHMTAPKYIIDSIDEYIRNNNLETN
jgi:hypothetical protein